MATFHALMLVCSLVAQNEGECDIMVGPGSPFTTREECQKTLKEGEQAIKEDAITMEALQQGAVDVSLVCHESEDDFVPEDNMEYLMKRYGPPQGEKI
jgi:hypothetical protein